MRNAANRKEVGVDHVRAWFRQRRVDHEAAVSLLSWVQVREIDQILADDKKVERHFVHNVKIFHGRAGFWMMNIENQPERLTSSDKRWLCS